MVMIRLTYKLCIHVLVNWLLITPHMNFLLPHVAVLDWELYEDEGSITINVQATRIDFSGLDCTRFSIVNDT